MAAMQCRHGPNEDLHHRRAATPGHMPWVGSYARTYAVGGQLRQDICHGWAATPGHMPWVDSYAMGSYAMDSCAVGSYAMGSYAGTLQVNEKSST